MKGRGHRYKNGDNRKVHLCTGRLESTGSVRRAQSQMPHEMRQSK